MGRFTGLMIAVTVCTLFPWTGKAQFTIRRETSANPVELPRPKDERFTNPNLGNLAYTTEAIQRAERRRIRRERNAWELNLGLKATQTYFSNWAKGGDNTFNGLATAFISHAYKRNKLSIITKFDARYGISVIDTIVFKNEDKFNLNAIFEWEINDKWSYSGAINFRSQFSRGYKSKTNNTLVSAFMSPGVLDIALGFTYGPEKSPFKITLSPVTGSILFVLNDELSEKKINGIDPGKHVKPMIGPSVNIDFDKTFAKDRLRYKSNFYSFYNFTLAPTARWENTFSIRATKFLDTSIYWLMIYDKEAETPHKRNKIQLTYSIGVGLNFGYKSK